MSDERIYPSYRHMQADIVGVYEIAANLGVSRATVNRWIERRDSTSCPEPIVRLKTGHIYSLNEWKGWYAVWKVTRGVQSWWTGGGTTYSSSG